MNVDNHALVGSYHNILTEASAPATLQFGKYKLIKAPQSAVTSEPYEQACMSKLISGQLKLFLRTMEDLGFNFLQAYRIEPTTYTSNRPDFVVLGEDPDGKPIAYSKKANVTSDAFLYYEDSKHHAYEIFDKFAELSRNTPLDEQSLLDKWIIGSWSMERNGGIRVHGNLEMHPFRVGYRVANFSQLPININSVSGDVKCSLSKLKTLTNFPKVIGSYCSLNSLANLENLTGVDDGKYGALRIYNCNALTSLKGIPIINGNCNIERCDLLTNLTDIKRINGELKITWCDNITDKQLADAYIGDKVRGEVLIYATSAHGMVKRLDKDKFKKEYLDALTGGEHDMDLTF